MGSFLKSYSILNFDSIFLFYSHLMSHHLSYFHLVLIFFTLKKLFVPKISFAFNCIYCINLNLYEQVLSFRVIIVCSINLYQSIFILTRHFVQSCEQIHELFENFECVHQIYSDCFEHLYQMIRYFCFLYLLKCFQAILIYLSFFVTFINYL